MVDIHCHIVPSVDDGAKDIEAALQMARLAKKAGYNEIIATSHYIIHDIENNYYDYIKKIDKLNKTYEQNGIDVKVYCGNEIFFTNHIVDLIKDKKVLTLANSRYVLFELPLYNKMVPMNFYDEINELRDLGYVPILAHPERYDFVQNDISNLVPLIESGVLMQSNIGSMYGKYGNKIKRTLKKMLKRDMVHFLATDSHNSNTYEKVPKAMDKIIKILKSEEHFNQIIENSQKILKNEKIDIWYPKE